MKTRPQRTLLPCVFSFVFLALSQPAHAQAPQGTKALEVSQRPETNPAYLNARGGPWCGANSLWQAKGLEQAAVTGCPPEGSCDNPGAQGGVWMNSIAAGTGGKTLTHEIGHCLGLWHTHHGVSEVSSCSDCYEYAGVNGVPHPEADYRGDFASDTPPTPRNYNCSPPGGSDCQGTSWGATQPENYMGYGPDGCLSLFTTQQKKRQQCWTQSELSSWFPSTCTDDADNDGVCDPDDICPAITITSIRTPTACRTAATRVR